MSKQTDAAWFHNHFPTSLAREAADKAIDKLDPRESMSVFIDVWVAAYIAAGGKTKLKI